jgi:hypothetical protein
MNLLCHISTGYIPEIGRYSRIGCGLCRSLGNGEKT